MNTKTVALLLVVLLLLNLAGCAKEKTISISLEELGDYEIVEMPTGLKNFSSAEGKVNLTVTKDGRYPLTVRSEDGALYYLTIYWENNTASLETGDSVTFDISVK